MNTELLDKIKQEVIMKVHESNIGFDNLYLEEQIGLWPEVCHRYSCQQLNEFKRKLKEEIDKLIDPTEKSDDFEDPDYISADYIKSLIDKVEL